MYVFRVSSRGYSYRSWIDINSPLPIPCKVIQLCVFLYIRRRYVSLSSMCLHNSFKCLPFSMLYVYTFHIFSVCGMFALLVLFARILYYHSVICCMICALVAVASCSYPGILYWRGMSQHYFEGIVTNTSSLFPSFTLSDSLSIFMKAILKIWNGMKHTLDIHAVQIF